jgi:hypothetical protein
MERLTLAYLPPFGNRRLIQPIGEMSCDRSLKNELAQGSAPFFGYFLEFPMNISRHRHPDLYFLVWVGRHS